MFIFDIPNGYAFCLEILASLGFRILCQYARNLHLFIILFYKTNSETNLSYPESFDYPKIISSKIKFFSGKILTFSTILYFKNTSTYHLYSIL